MRAFEVKTNIEVNRKKGDGRAKNHLIKNFMAVQEASYAASPSEAERSKEENELRSTSETFLASDHEPELVAFLQESDYQSVKDIFIDREFPSRSRLKHKDVSSMFQQDVDCHSKEPRKTLRTMSSISNEIEQEFQTYVRKQHVLENLIKDSEEDSDGRDDYYSLDMSTVKMIPGMQCVKEFEVGDSISLNPTETSATEPIGDNSHLSEVSSNSEAESESSIHISDSSLTTMSSHGESLEGSESQKPHKTESLSRESQSFVNELGYGDCGSFAVSPLSGPTQCSGCISLRSTSSTTSSHSFVFPILPSEWNGSPVRMVKADQRQQIRRPHSWRTCFLCCKF